LTTALLFAADTTIREISGKISKIIRWELLYTNLLKAKKGQMPISDLDKRVKSCLTSLKIDAGKATACNGPNLQTLHISMPTLLNTMSYWGGIRGESGVVDNTRRSVDSTVDLRDSAVGLLDSAMGLVDTARGLVDRQQAIGPDVHRLIAQLSVLLITMRHKWVSFFLYEPEMREKNIYEKYYHMPKVNNIFYNLIYPTLISFAAFSSLWSPQDF